jgi:hypothetical protein
VKLRTAGAAGKKLEFPAWVAVIEQVPVETKAMTPALVAVQTGAVVEA